MTILTLKKLKTPSLEELCSELYSHSEAISKTVTRIEEIKSLLKERALSEKRSYSCKGVLITYRKAHTRMSWDSKKLDTYAITHPDIEEFKKTSDISQNAAIKVII